MDRDCANCLSTPPAMIRLADLSMLEAAETDVAFAQLRLRLETSATGRRWTDVNPARRLL
jgi:hypothetical protein